METIVDGMATIIWGDAWASAQEEAGVSLSGVKIEDVMPPIPDSVRNDAWRLLGMIEAINNMSVEALLHQAAKADAGGDEEKLESLFNDDDYARRFGECLAFQSLGHGVSWFDDHAQFPLTLPHFESLAAYNEAQDTVEASPGP